MKILLFIFIGGGIGSVARYLLTSWITRLNPHPFPLGTLIVNIVACLLVGVIAGLAGHSNKNEILRPVLLIGFCGGFSTFSAFTLDSVRLLNADLSGQMIWYIALSLFGCVGATFVGLWLAGR